MKILHLSKFYPPEPGGIENFVFDLANEQVRQGHDVYVVSHQSVPGTPSKHETIHGVHLDRIRTFGQVAYTPVCPGFLFQLRTVIRQFRPDVIHAHVPNVSAFWLLFLKKTCPLILHWHADVVASRIDRKLSILYHLYKPWETRLLSKTDRIICTSTAYASTSKPLQKWKDKCAVIPLGLDPARMAATDDMPPVKKRRKNLTVLSIGRFTYYKGFEYLIQAAEKTPDVDFIIVGEGQTHEKIKNLIRNKGLQDRVLLPGKVSRKEIVGLFRQCDIFCLPSIERTEAFGLVLLEAMVFGKPLITTAIEGSGISEVNQHRHTGLQVPVADAESLAWAIQFFGNNPKKRLEMGQIAKKRFQSHFDIHSVAHRIETVYESLIHAGEKRCTKMVY